MQTSVLRPTWLCLSLTFKVFAKDCILLSSPSRSAAVSILRFGQNQSNYLQNSENCCSCTDFEVEKLNEGEKFELLKKINDHLGAPGPNLQKNVWNWNHWVLSFSLRVGWWTVFCCSQRSTLWILIKASKKVEGSWAANEGERKKTLDLYTFPIKGKKLRRSIRFFCSSSR